MLYYLFQYLDQAFNLPGTGLFNFISFRSGAAFILSLFIAAVFGEKIIRFLQRKQVGETVRDLGLEGQMKKQGTPTMGGIIIILAIVIPCLIVGRLGNIYMLLMLFTTIWLGAIGALDDYIKVFKKDKEGLQGRFKIVGQVGLGLIVGLILVFSPDVVIRENTTVAQSGVVEVVQQPQNVKSTITTIPFFKNNNLDYADLFRFAGDHAQTLGWIFFIFVVIFIVTAVSNGANLTDGIDGLAAGSSAIVGVVLGILAYLSSNIRYAAYLNIMFIPGSEELVVFAAAFIGALIGFLWYNTYPAQVFMGDTGSLTIGGIIAVFAIAIRKELLIPILCGIFLVQSVSVMMQVWHFKATKRKTGVGSRLFLMAPLHHHYQKKGMPEAKIVIRFLIVGVILAAFTLITLKIR